MTVHDCSGGGTHVRIAGEWAEARSYACTTSAATTDRINKKGLAYGVVFNESGSAETITYYAAYTETGTLRPLHDEDGVAVTQTLADGDCLAIPSAAAGAPYIGVVGDGGCTLIFHFER